MVKFIKCKKKEKLRDINYAKEAVCEWLGGGQEVYSYIEQVKVQNKIFKMDIKFINVLLLGFGFMFVFTAFQTTGNIQVSEIVFVD